MGAIRWLCTQRRESITAGAEFVGILDLFRRAQRHDDGVEVTSGRAEQALRRLIEVSAGRRKAESLIVCASLLIMPSLPIFTILVVLQFGLGASSKHGRQDEITLVGIVGIFPVGIFPVDRPPRMS
jgi:hypothetical protein